MQPPALLQLESHCLAALFAGDAPLFALADGTVHTGAASARAHDAMLAAAAEREALLTSGEDGRICRTDRSGRPSEIAVLPRKWISCIARGPQDAIAFAAGRSVWLRLSDGELRELRHPRAVAGVAFSPDGCDVAVSRYNGVTIHALDGIAAPVEFEWKGIYADLTYSPDGHFIVAAMQENLMHGWRLRDRRHFRMTGYPAKVKAWSWTASGRWLATSGAATAVVWPFEGVDGPIGRAAMEVGPARADALVTAVACHPVQDVVAIGYADGAIAVAAIDTDSQQSVRGPGRGAITCLAWDDGGSRVAFGSQSGECGIILTESQGEPVED
jgi:WD40 repeat protein